MARYLYWGCDVWLNNPLRPLEACGTSGMKAALNGGLNLSIRDGWWDEWFDGQNGWAIPTADGVDGPRPARRGRGPGDLRAARATRCCRGSTRPAADGVPARWVEMVRHTLRETGPKVLATRMVRDYVQALYVPAARLRPGRWPSTATARRARRPAWRAHLLQHWHDRPGGPRRGTGAGDTPEIGSTLALRAEVELPGLAPDDVQVQAAYGRVDDADGLHEVTTVPMEHEQTEGSRHWFTATLPLERTGAFGYTVRVLPHSEHLADPAELGVVTSA